MNIRTTSTRQPATLTRPTARTSSSTNLLAGPRNVKPYIPRRGEQYMNKEQLEHFRQILNTWKRDLMHEVDRTVLHMKDEAANFPDPNDRATQESEFSLELRTRDRERKLIRKIDEAIKRIEDGTYGYCVETGEEIGIKRLEARPVATLCVEAQERRERREKQYGDRDDRYQLKQATCYRGRFAPSPTGPLHFGSLVAAAAQLSRRAPAPAASGCCESKTSTRRARCPAAPTRSSRRSMHSAFEWNGSIVRQSARHAAYQAALDRLLNAGLRASLFVHPQPSCKPRNRRDAIESDELYYPGWCRNGVRAPDRPLAIRFRCRAGTIAFDDLLQGCCRLLRCHARPATS